MLLTDTPLTENGDYRLEVLISVRRLERLDKDEYLQEERSEAETIYEERRVKELEDASGGGAAGGGGDAKPDDNESKVDSED